MGVFSSGGINFARISDEMRKTMLPWFNATIQIVDPNVGDVEWDVYSNTQTGGTKTVLWSGSARVQHLSHNAIVESGYSQTDIRGVRVQLPFDVDYGFIRRGLQVIVTDGGSDPILEQFTFVVSSAINSSYAWSRTIECDVDMKSVSNSTWATISGTVLDAESNGIANANIRSFHSEDGVWLLDYETKSDAYGNYELPADAGVAVIVGAFKNGYFTEYWEASDTTSTATMITPTNHNDTPNIDFVMVVD